jgi:hypothetical protein
MDATGDVSVAEVIAEEQADPNRPPDADGPPAASWNARPLWSVPPVVVLPRLTGPLELLIARKVARHERGNLIALYLEPDEAIQGGTATISMPVDIRCPECRYRTPGDCPVCAGRGSWEEICTAWLTVPRQVTHGAILGASVELPHALAVVRFRVLIDGNED